MVGVGVNLASPPPNAPHATSLAEHGVVATPNDLLSHLDAAMQSWLGVWNEGAGFEAVRRAWLARAGNRGDHMTVHAGDDVVSGRFAGLDGDGALLIDTQEGPRRRFSFGDVTFNPPDVPRRINSGNAAPLGGQASSKAG